MTRAEEVLAKLEVGEQAGVLAKLADDLPLFAAAPPPPETPAPQSALAEAFNEVDADDLTPRAALELLYRLKALAEDSH